MFKVIIAGGRKFTDYNVIKANCIQYLENIADEIEIVSGGARGVDALGEYFAKEMGCSLTVMNAKWDTLGKSAGYIRNEEMANYADALIAFHNGTSRGTAHMIRIAEEKGLKVHVVQVNY